MHHDPYISTDKHLLEILHQVRDEIAASEAERLRYERSLRGRLARIDWFLVALIAIVTALAALCIYAGYLEATAPIPPAGS